MLSLALTLGLCLSAHGAGSATLKGGTSVTVGGTVELIVNVSGCAAATSVAVAVTYGSGLELVSGTWLKSGAMSLFDASTNKGVLGGLSAADVNGDLFRLVLKANTASADQSVAINVIAKNDKQEVLNVTPTVTLQANATTHTYGSWTQIKPPTCTEDGLKTATCTLCGAKTEEKLPAKGHSFGSGVVTTAPTQNRGGTITYTCKICNQTRQEALPPLATIDPVTSAEGSSAPSVGTSSAPGKTEDAARLLALLAAAVVLGGGVILLFVFKKKSDPATKA